MRSLTRLSVYLPFTLHLLKRKWIIYASRVRWPERAGSAGDRESQKVSLRAFALVQRANARRFIGLSPNRSNASFVTLSLKAAPRLEFRIGTGKATEIIATQDD